MARPNTLVPGIIELAERHRPFISGDDLKSVFSVDAGIKSLSIIPWEQPVTVVSFYPQFKSSTVNDMIGANRLLYKAPESRCLRCVG
jgi:myo-inositol-1-phosphate synthase